MMKVGSVVIDEYNNKRVVKEVINGYPTETELLENYIQRVTVVKSNGKYKSIKDCVDERCNEYMDNAETIHLSSDLTGGSK